MGSSILQGSPRPAMLAMAAAASVQGFDFSPICTHAFSTFWPAMCGVSRVFGCRRSGR
jgi:hypothetical protein